MAATQDLSSAKYLAQAEEARAAALATELNDNSAQLPGTSATTLEQMTKWVSLVAGLALVVSIVVLAVPYLSALRSPKPSNPIDMMLRLGGAHSDQTFEKYLRESAAANQREWEERYRDSPAYQLDSGQMNWNFDAAPLFK
jgi:hypothetical protein